MAWLYRQKGSANWWLGYRVNGKQVLRSTGTSDRSKAEIALGKVETMFSAGKVGALTEELFKLLTGNTTPRKTLTSAMGEWIDACKVSTAPRTLEKYAAIQRDFLVYLEADDSKPLLSDVTTDSVRLFMLAKSKTRSIATVNQYRKILSVFFLYAIRNGMLSANPVVAIKKFREPKTESRRAFTSTEISTIYSKCPDDFWRYMVLAGFYSGQRLGDLICLRWGNVDFDANALRLTTAKTGRAMVIPMAKPLCEALLARRREFNVVTPSTHVWPDQAKQYIETGTGHFSNAFYDILTAAGLTPQRSKVTTGLGRAAKRQISTLSYHSLRHTFVSMLKITGGNQAIAKELAGHGSDLVSDNYTHLPEEVLAAAINQLPELRLMK